jgi:aldehyde dehydrogenase (NAD+)
MSKYQPVFDQLSANAIAIGSTNYKERSTKILKIEKALLKYRKEIQEALFKDFRKHESEVDLSEIFPILKEASFVRKRLKKWMTPVRVPTPITLLGSTSKIRYESKGVVLILSPWNFPINLTFGPLISAVAAGNVIALKPSEHTPHASAITRKIIEEIFPPNEVVVIEGGVEDAKALLELPFHHIFFTGAPAVGKEIMKAAATNLTSVTLELGGKSPTIIDESASLDTTAKRIVYSKLMNNGQICIAPDYVLVQESIKDQLIQKIKKYSEELYGSDPKISPEYCRMVNQRQFARVTSYIDEAMREGAKLEMGGDYDPEEVYISPTVISGLTSTSKVLNEEIFGPVLPMVTFRKIEEAIQFVNEKERPLALYIYSQNHANIRKIIKNTRAGATCVNNSIVHFFNNHLPFGGVNHSGIGNSRGWFGFESFSNARAEYMQFLPGATDLLGPPFTGWKKKLIDFTMKWL